MSILYGVLQDVDMNFHKYSCGKDGNSIYSKELHVIARVGSVYFSREDTEKQ